jgi:hypothetical protein
MNSCGWVGAGAAGAIMYEVGAAWANTMFGGGAGATRMVCAGGATTTGAVGGATTTGWPGGAA